ncbi:MAG: alkylmercury lyase family protein [Proteobacteria bacterium]|nr:alkylmercury lyase family protein [Pseudomonadota bacterium]
MQISVDAAGQVIKAPTGVLVWLSINEGCGCAATSKCPLINFFCGQEHLASWRLDNPYEPGYVLNLDKATALGKCFFGDFLS